MEKIFKLTICATSEDKARKKAMKRKNVKEILQIVEASKIYDVVVLVNEQEEKVLKSNRVG